MSTLELENIKHPDNANTNIALASNGSITVDRRSTDGTIAEFRKDGTAHGGINASGGSLVVGGGDVGIGFYQGANALVPYNQSTNAARDAAIDLGYGAGYRWKDLYLSGGVVFGTGGPSPITSNTLDDYEEGTFSPTMTLSTPGTSSFAYLAQSGQYRKVGNIVTFTLELRMNTISYGNGSGNLTIAGLPFNFANTGGYGSSLCNIMLYGGAISSGRTPFASGVSNTTNILLLQMASSTATTTLVVSNYNTIQVSGTYITP
jgi:hypothetical protein